MKIQTTKLQSVQWLAVAAALGLWHAPVGASAAGESAAELTNSVPFELGQAQFAPGDSITIQHVQGTSDKIVVGGTYSVDGTYTLASHDEAKLAFFVTTQSSSGPTPVDPRQQMKVKNGTGSFHLIKKMSEDGYMHVSFYPIPSGNACGGEYFGQGDRVLRSAAAPIIDNINSEPGERHGTLPGAPSSTTGAGPNQLLLQYLGNPVEPPVKLDARYTKQGLTEAIQTAARGAGITVKRMEVEDSEFPFLIGAVCAGSDAGKLKGQLKKSEGYEYGGGIGNDVNGDGSDTCNVFCMVPHQAYPPGSEHQIYHRLWLREQVFFDRFNGR
ncbi:MAG: hypothetical protein ABSH48_04305 [Verrucomicrobiota bacterium]|jgi:hypothetical protein